MSPTGSAEGAGFDGGAAGLSFGGGVGVRTGGAMGLAAGDSGGGAASVDVGKRRKLVFAAEHFLAAHRDLARLPCRFDVIDASGDPDAPTFTWLRDAFRADDV